MTYKFKWKRKWIYHTKVVLGHNYNQVADKMVLYYPNGSIEEIPRWKDCAVKLGVDWVLAVKKSMEAKTGQSIPLAIDVNTPT